MSKESIKIKTYELTNVKKGMQFPYSDTYWKVKEWDETNYMWICKDIWGGKLSHFTEEKILEIILKG